jgi:hypothetical protein
MIYCRFEHLHSACGFGVSCECIPVYLEGVVWHLVTHDYSFFHGIVLRPKLSKEPVLCTAPWLFVQSEQFSWLKKPHRADVCWWMCDTKEKRSFVPRGLLTHNLFCRHRMGKDERIALLWPSHHQNRILHLHPHLKNRILRVHVPLAQDDRRQSRDENEILYSTVLKQ